MNEHKFKLETYRGLSTRHECPNCKHKKTFTRYIDIDTNVIINTNVGRCERVDNCGYHYTPKQYFQDNNITIETKIAHTNPVKIQPKKVSFIEPVLFVASLKQYNDNNFVKYLITLFGLNITESLISKYYIGTSNHWTGSSVFWQIDNNNKIRTGKIMQYSPATGKRVKEPYNLITWVHSVVKQPDFNLKQCLFGEHLLSDKTKAVCIVESEKTAIIASVYLPQFIWLAVGSLTNLTSDKCEVLKGRSVLLYPDLRAFDKWNAKAKELSNIAKFVVSDLLECKASDTEKANGLDLADYLIRYDFREFNNVPTIEPIKSPVKIPEPPRTPEPIQEPEPLEKVDLLPDDWNNTINELEAYFNTLLIPVEPVVLNQFTAINDVSFFVDSHLNIVKARNGNKTYIPYLNRLKELKQNLTASNN